MKITLNKKQFQEFMQDISKFHNATTRCGYPLEPDYYVRKIHGETALRIYAVTPNVTYCYLFTEYETESPTENSIFFRVLHARENYILNHAEFNSEKCTLTFPDSDCVESEPEIIEEKEKDCSTAVTNISPKKIGKFLKCLVKNSRTIMRQLKQASTNTTAYVSFSNGGLDIILSSYTTLIRCLITNTEPETQWGTRYRIPIDSIPLVDQILNYPDIKRFSCLVNPGNVIFLTCRKMLIVRQFNPAEDRRFACKLANRRSIQEIPYERILSKAENVDNFTVTINSNELKNFLKESKNFPSAGKLYVTAKIEDPESIRLIYWQAVETFRIRYSTVISAEISGEVAIGESLLNITVENLNNVMNGIPSKKTTISRGQDRFVLIYGQEDGILTQSVTAALTETMDDVRNREGNTEP